MQSWWADEQDNNREGNIGLNMRNIKLVIEYDGTNYCGWQTQPNGIAIQEVLEQVIEKVTQQKVSLNGSGRTDSGVHAIGQVASFTTNSSIPSEIFSLAINAFLPNDISVVRSEEVALDFHARFSAKGKTYRYYIWNDKRRSGILSNLTCHIPVALDVDKMHQAAQCFVGQHDFSAFMAQGSSIKTTVREIYSAKVFQVTNPFGDEIGKMICIELTGSGFLYNMVRIIAGTLMEVALCKRSEVQVIEALSKGERTMAGQTMPPEGLFLYEVIY